MRFLVDEVRTVYPCVYECSFSLCGLCTVVLREPAAWFGLRSQKPYYTRQQPHTCSLQMHAPVPSYNDDDFEVTVRVSGCARWFFSPKRGDDAGASVHGPCISSEACGSESSKLSPAAMALSSTVGSESSKLSPGSGSGVLRLPTWFSNHAKPWYTRRNPKPQTLPNSTDRGHRPFPIGSSGAMGNEEVTTAVDSYEAWVEMGRRFKGAHRTALEDELPLLQGLGPQTRLQGSA
jgi:hypothetical protein